MRLRIILDNNKSRIVGSRKVVMRLRDTFKLKSPGYFWSLAYRKRIWDGYINYVSETGLFSTGHLDQVCGLLKKWNKKYIIEDGRESFKDLHIVKRLGDKTFRPYQVEALKHTLGHRLEGVKFIRGILHEATNAGKNLIAAGIFESFSNKRRGLFLIDNKEIFDQALVELGELLPGQIGQVSSGKVAWNRVTVCMVQSLSNLIKKDYKAKAMLAKQDIILVDECDTTATKKQGKTVLSFCINAPIRIGLSGTPLAHKDKTRNQAVLSFFGPVIHKVSNKFLVDEGYSAKPNIKIVMGNTKHIYPGDYEKEYRRGIVKSRERARVIWNLVAQQLSTRTPILILVKLHKQIEYLLKYCPEDIMDSFTIEYVHHKTPNRADIFKRFSQEKIPILISSMIIRRGKNIPIMRTLINAAGGDSEANLLQILGRGLRRLPGQKDEIDVYEFYDNGKYLMRHSKHRINWYKKEGFWVDEIWKKTR